jgi:hypothetical protein
VLFAIVTGMSTSSEGHAVASSVIFVEKLGIAGNVELEIVSNVALASLGDNFLDEVTDVIDKLSVIEQTPSISSLFITSSLLYSGTGWVPFQNAVEDDTRKINIVTTNS